MKNTALVAITSASPTDQTNHVNVRGRIVPLTINLQNEKICQNHSFSAQDIHASQTPAAPLGVH